MRANPHQRGAGIVKTRGCPQGFGGEHEMRGQLDEFARLRHRPVAVDDDRQTTPRRRDAEGHDQIRQPIVDQHGVDVGNQGRGIGGRGGKQLFVATRRGHALAGRIDDDAGDRGGRTRNAHDARRDTFVGEASQDAVADRIA